MNNPKQISGDLEDIEKRLMAASEAQDPAKVPFGAEKGQEEASILLKNGFPLRHVNQISAGLWGPGFEMMNKHLNRILAGDALIVLTGNRGPGKTQIAVTWAAERFRAGKAAGRYIKCADLIGEIKETWGKSTGERAILEKYRRTAYLVIDEFHEKGASEWEARTLVNLLDHRYDDCKCTVLIANIQPDIITEAINPSIMDRANQTGGVINCNWESYR